MFQEFLQKAWDAKCQGNFAEAEVNYLACLECDPENAEALREQGLMYWANFKKTPEAIVLIERSLAFKECADGHHFLALVTQEHDVAKSLAEFRKALEGYDREANVTGLMGLAHCNYAHVLSREDEILEAEKHYLEAVRIDPDNEDIQKYSADFQSSVGGDLILRQG